jgi:creatinine amidohydrolase
VAILPAGAIEAHGPHLPLGTDGDHRGGDGPRRGQPPPAARGLHVPLLPALTMAPAPFAAELPGTVNAPPEATTMIVTSVVRSLADCGIAVTAIANAHHDPAHVDALRRAVSEISASSSEADRGVSGSGQAPLG